MRVRPVPDRLADGVGGEGARPVPGLETDDPGPGSGSDSAVPVRCGRDDPGDGGSVTEAVMGGIVTGSVSVAGVPRQEGPAAGGVVCGGQIGVRGVDTGIDDAHGGAFAGGG